MSITLTVCFVFSYETIPFIFSKKSIGRFKVNSSFRIYNFMKTTTVITKGQSSHRGRLSVAVLFKMSPIVLLIVTKPVTPLKGRPRSQRRKLSLQWRVQIFRISDILWGLTLKRTQTVCYRSSTSMSQDKIEDTIT